MRRFIVPAAIAAVAVILSGCTLIADLSSAFQITTASPVYGTEDTSGLTYPTPVTDAPDIFHYYPSIQDVSESDVGVHPESGVYDVTSDDGELLVRAVMTLPKITFVGETPVQESVDKLLDSVKGEFENRINRLSDSYISDIQSGYKVLTNPKFSVSYTLTDFSSEFASILYSIVQTNSDGISSTDYFCLVIDLKAGFKIDLSTLFSGGLSDRLLSLINEKLASCGKKLYSIYEQIAAEQIKSCWMISNGGIKFIFSARIIAPASEGTVEITLENSEINGLLNDYGTALLGDFAATVPETDDNDDD